MDGKYVLCMVFYRNCIQKIRLSKVRRPTGSHVHRKVSKKWCEIDMLLLHTTNRTYHMAYLFIPFPMTLDDFEGHLPNA